MTLYKFAWNNVVRDKRSYLAYFISSMFSVFIFFSFAVSMYHPSLSVIESGSSLFIALLCGSVVVYIFSFLFLGYSMNAFFKTRKKQFGLLTLIGASKKQLNRLIFIENVTIGFGAIISGIGLGLLFARIFLLMEEKMIQGISFPMYMPIKAIIVSVFLFGILFLCVSLFIPHLIKKKEITILLNTDKMEETKENHKLLLLSIGILSVLGFIGSLFAPGKEMAGFRSTTIYPVVLLIFVMLMTYVLFRQVFGDLLRFISKTKMYYKRTNMLVCTSLIGKHKENASMMFLTCILCAISFIVMVGFTIVNERVYSDIDKKIPYAHCFIVDKNTKKAQDMLMFLKNQLENKPGFMEAQFELLNKKDSHERAFLSESDYKVLRKLIDGKIIKLKHNEVYLFAGNAGEKYNPKLTESDKKELKSILQDVKIAGADNKLLLVTGAYTKYIVIPESAYKKLKDNKNYNKQMVYAFQTKNWKTDTKTDEKIMKTLSNDMDIQIANGYRYNQKSYWYGVDKTSGNLMQYVAFLLSFVFVIASASLIYSRIYMNLDKEIKKYKSIVKMGLSKQELTLIVGKELSVLLILPFFVALLYMWLAIGTAGVLFHVSIDKTIYVYSIVFILAEIILYEFVRRIYTQKLLKEVFS